MLQAQIEIVDEAGHIEDSVTIVGSGRVSLGMRDGSYLHADEAAPDLAVIQHTGSHLYVQVKASNALRQDADCLPLGVVDVGETFVAVIEAWFVGHYLKIKPLHIEGAELLSGGAVIRSMPSPFQSRLDERAARGTRRVREQLDRLRAQGKIDDAGNALVPLPADLLPDSPTDV